MTTSTSTPWPAVGPERRRIERPASRAARPVRHGRRPLATPASAGPGRSARTDAGRSSEPGGEAGGRQRQPGPSERPGSAWPSTRMPGSAAPGSRTTSHVRPAAPAALVERGPPGAGRRGRAGSPCSTAGVRVAGRRGSDAAPPRPAARPGRRTPGRRSGSSRARPRPSGDRRSRRRRARTPTSASTADRRRRPDRAARRRRTRSTSSRDRAAARAAGGAGAQVDPRRAQGQPAQLGRRSRRLEVDLLGDQVQLLHRHLAAALARPASGRPTSWAGRCCSIQRADRRCGPRRAG